MLSNEYLKTARTLFRIARSMADQAIADRLRALAEEYERRAEQASDSDVAQSGVCKPLLPTFARE